MNKVLLIARWEFITTVTRRAYIFAVIAMPLFYGGMIALAGMAGRSASTNAGRIPTPSWIARTCSIWPPLERRRRARSGRRG